MKFNVKKSLFSAVVALMMINFANSNSFAQASIKNLSGLDRFSTAVSISKSGWGAGSDTVILVNSRSVADSLAVAPLASKMKSPVLLTESSSLNQITMDEINRLKPEKVVIIGGENSVSSSVEGQFKELGLEVQRISGSSRVETSINIANEIMKIKGDKLSEVFVVNGVTGLPDAAGVGAIASKRDAGIIFVDNNTLNIIGSTLDSVNSGKEYIIGGNNSIPMSFTNTRSNSERISGKDRQDTNYSLIKKFYPNFSTVYIADDGSKNPSKLIDSVLINAGIIASQSSSSSESKLNDGPVLLVSETTGLSVNQYDLLISESSVNEINQVSGGNKFADSISNATYFINGNAEAIAKFEKFKNYKNMEVEYKIDDKKVKLDGNILSSLVTLNPQKDSGVDINVEAVKNVVKKISPNGIKQNTNDSYAYWQNNNVVVTSTSTILINVEEETKRLIEILESGKSTYDIVPSFNKVKLPGSATNIGKKYVVINLQNQKMDLHENGRVTLSTPVVTGNPNRGMATPPGIFKLRSKARNVVLRGPGYASPVKYWMPFNGSIGIHDSYWQPAYGGKRYLYAGSHGCVNTPLDKVGKLYGKISVGTPVICIRK